MMRQTVGKMEDYGLPKPDHRVGEAHPTVSGRILDRLAHGAITPRPNIARIHDHEVEFTDGSRVEADLIVYCTGYKISFPFFDEDFISAPDNHIELFRRVFHPDIPDVAFIALLQPLGAIMPLAEAQGQWLASYLKGEYHLPAPDAMRDDIRRDMEAMRKRYVASKRHTIQVDFDEYLLALAKERKAGGERARQAGFALPVPARARAEEPATA
jgi:dimethylaniline monooxygenase (N-oxide forming)